MSDTRENLQYLATTLEELHPVDAPPAWIELTGPLEEPARVTWHIEGLDSLFGYTAPSDCEAVAMVADGWGHGLGGPGPPGLLAPGERRRIRVSVLVTRTGERAGRLLMGDGVVHEAPPGAGRALDCLLRCLGLPTEPPAVSTDHVLAIVWLLNLQAAAKQGRHLTWAQAAGMHPAMQVMEEAGEAVPIDQLTAVLRTSANVWTWSNLREAASTGWLAEQLPPHAGHWMDEGMLARWLLDSWPAPGALLSRVTRHVPSDVSRRLRRTLTDLGVTR